MNKDEELPTLSSILNGSVGKKEVLSKVSNRLARNFQEYGWKHERDLVLEMKEGYSRDMFVVLFITALKNGELPDDAMQYLVDGMMKNRGEVAKILGVAFGKGEERKVEMSKKSFRIALEVAVENKALANARDISEDIFERVADKVSTEVSTVIKYYRDHFHSMEDIVGRDKNSDVLEVLLVHLERQK